MPLCTDLRNYIDTKLSEIKVAPDVGSSEKLKVAMIEFLIFEKELVNDAFTPFANMNENTTGEEIQKAAGIMMEKTKEESKYLLKVQVAQKEYAAKNGFKMAEIKP